MLGLINRTRDINPLNVIGVLTIPGLLFCSGSAASICYSGYSLPISATLASVWFIVFLAHNPKMSLRKPAALTFSILILGSVLSLFFSDFSGWTSFAMFICVLTVAYLLVRILGVRAVTRGYIGTLEFLSGISLIGFLIFEVFGIYPPFPQMSTHTGSTIYSNAIVFVVDLGLNSGRNIGIFWEPSIYAAYLNIAIAITLFLDQSNKRTNRILLFVLVLLTTESAGGFIELLCIFVAYWYHRGSKPIVIVCLLALFAMFLLTYTQLQSLLLGFNYEFFYKFFGGSGSGTTQTRLECPVLNMAIWFKSPLFGSGFYGTDVMYNQLRLASNISNLAQTSTITYLPAAIGILGFWLLIACVYGFNKLVNLPPFSKIALFVAAMVFLNEEPCTYFIAVYLLLFLLLELSNKDSVIRFSVQREVLNDAYK